MPMLRSVLRKARAGSPWIYAGFLNRLPQADASREVPGGRYWPTHLPVAGPDFSEPLRRRRPRGLPAHGRDRDRCGIAGRRPAETARQASVAGTTGGRWRSQESPPAAAAIDAGSASALSSNWPGGTVERPTLAFLLVARLFAAKGNGGADGFLAQHGAIAVRGPCGSA